MKETALKNTSNLKIGPYPIAEAVLDENGNARLDEETQQTMTTGTTHTWEIDPGDTRIFPSYVALYLKGIYPFLEEVALEDVRVEPELKQELKPEPVKKTTTSIVDDETVKYPVLENGKFRCKFCNKEVANRRGLGLHIASAHPEALE